MKKSFYAIFAIAVLVNFTVPATAFDSPMDSILGDWESKSWILGKGVLRVTQLGDDHILVRDCVREVNLATNGSECISENASAFEYRPEIPGFCKYRADNMDNYCEISVYVQDDELIIRKWPSDVHPRLPFGVIAIQNQEILGGVRESVGMENTISEVNEVLGNWGSLSYGLALKSKRDRDLPADTVYEIREAGTDAIIVTALTAEGGLVDREEFVYDETVNGFCSVEEPGNRWLKYCARLLTVKDGNGVKFLRETWHPREIAGRLHFRPGNRVPTIVAYLIL